MKNNWCKIQRLGWAECWLLLQALVLLPLMGLALRLIGLQRWQSVLVRLAPLREVPAEGKARAEIPLVLVIARLVRAAARHGLYRGSCLQQSLTLWWLLRRQGTDSQLRIGVRRDASRLQAHAWVEFQGLVLNDRDDVQRTFAPFNRAIVPPWSRCSTYLSGGVCGIQPNVAAHDLRYSSRKTLKVGS